MLTFQFAHGCSLFLQLALESSQGVEGTPDGQFLAVSSPHIVLGGHEWVSIIRLSLGINSYWTLFALHAIQGPEGKLPIVWQF